MRPLYRKAQKKSHAAKTFRRQAGKTKAVNVAAPMRGGIRL